MPGAFLPAAERYGLASKIDRWVVTAVLHWLEEHADGVGLCGVNLSGQSLGDRSFFKFVTDALRGSTAAPERICFEITETSAIANLADAVTFIRDARDLGCRFALDDFGSGMASFAYLKTLPVDFLKIDGTFVRDIVEDSIDRALVRSINDIGHVMGKQTIAEYVETQPTCDLLRDMGVDFAQGYLFGQPRPA